MKRASDETVTAIKEARCVMKIQQPQVMSETSWWIINNQRKSLGTANSNHCILTEVWMKWWNHYHLRVIFVVRFEDTGPNLLKTNHCASIAVWPKWKGKKKTSRNSKITSPTHSCLNYTIAAECPASVSPFKYTALQLNFLQQDIFF